MKCPKCNSSKFTIKTSNFSSKIKNLEVEVLVPHNFCENCGTACMDIKQMNHLRRAASDKYREMHKLLTSKAIIQYRKNFGMSQAAFAEYLNIGKASLKRWETYFIQDESHNDLILLKCDLNYAASNFLLLQAMQQKVDIYSGEKSFSLPRFKYLESYLIKSLNKSDDQHSKLHFYIDFLHFKRHRKGITGFKYVPLKYGPAPYQYKIYSESMRDINTETNLETKEKQTIDDICGLYNQENGIPLNDLAKKEKGFLETGEFDFISYKYAHDLLI